MVETRGERGRGLVGAGEVVVVEMIVEPYKETLVFPSPML